MTRTRTAGGVTFCALTALCGTASTPASAQTCTSAGPDVIVGVLGPGVANYASVGGIEGFSVGTTLCNIGSAPLDFFANSNRHPVVAQNLYRLKLVGGASRFEQIGMSWCFNTFIALSQNTCCSDCVPAGGTSLGAHCASPETASIMGTITAQTPRWQLNPVTGAFLFPGANPAQQDSLARRLRVAIPDLVPSQQGGGRYFVEHIAITPDDSTASNALNNYSHREATITGTAAAWNIAIIGTTQATSAALLAWASVEPGVTIVTLDVPGDSRFLLAGKATEISPGVWRYEYAVENLTSDRAARDFAVPLSTSITPTNIGFHDVDYHSGDGPGNVNFDGTDWDVTLGAQVRWSAPTFADNPSANALRWGTLYNFRFDAPVAPATGSITLGLFKPGTPESVVVPGLPIPGMTTCPADWNHSGNLNSQDYFDFLSEFFAQHADFNGDMVTNSQDFFDFLAAFFTGC